MATIAWKWIALMGVRSTGRSVANQRGSSPPRPIEKIDRVAAVAPEFAFANELLMMANTTRMPPSVPSTSVAIPPQGSLLLKVRKPPILSGPKYTVAA